MTPSRVKHDSREALWLMGQLKVAQGRLEALQLKLKGAEARIRYLEAELGHARGDGFF
jgi:hypothetical protein